MYENILEVCELIDKLAIPELRWPSVFCLVLLCPIFPDDQFSAGIPDPIASHRFTFAPGRTMLFPMDACNDINDCRTRTGIVMSCVYTIFLCTWATFHPSVLGPQEPE